MYPGPFHPYVASVLALWREGGVHLDAVGEDLRRLGLTSEVEPRRSSDSEIELLVGRTASSRDLVNIADVGIGVSQVLPVVVALRVAGPHQLVHIEQPELHLHPNAQVHLADLLVDAAVRGVNLIVETHSALVLRGIQLAVAEGRINPVDVSLNWFTRDSVGATHVRTAELDGQGSYGDWPVDFADIEMSLDERYIGASIPKVSTR